MGRPLVVVSGGTRGIGRAVVRAFADKSCDIVTCARGQSDLTLLEEEVKAQYHVDFHVFKADLSQKKEVDDFVYFIETLDRRVSVLVNNAGYFCPGNIENEQEGVLEQMMNTNLYSAYYLTRGLLPFMKKEKSAHIFNVSSVAGLKAYPGGGSYSISKFALRGFSENLRQELLPQNIRVTAVYPGAVYTSSWDGFDGPQDRLMPPEDIAKSIVDVFELSGRTVVEEIVLRPQLGDI